MHLIAEHKVCPFCMAKFDICRKAVKAKASMNANVLIVSERRVAFPFRTTRPTLKCQRAAFYHLASGAAPKMVAKETKND